MAVLPLSCWPARYGNWPTWTPYRRRTTSTAHRSGEVHALRSKRFSSVQFHLESVLTQNGRHIVAKLLTDLRPGPLSRTWPVVRRGGAPPLGR